MFITTTAHMSQQHIQVNKKSATLMNHLKRLHISDEMVVSALSFPFFICPLYSDSTWIRMSLHEQTASALFQVEELSGEQMKVAHCFQMQWRSLLRFLSEICHRFGPWNVGTVRDWLNFWIEIVFAECNQHYKFHLEIWHSERNELFKMPLNIIKKIKHFEVCRCASLHCLLPLKTYSLDHCCLRCFSWFHVYIWLSHRTNSTAGMIGYGL